MADDASMDHMFVGAVNTSNWMEMHTDHKTIVATAIGRKKSDVLADLLTKTAKAMISHRANGGVGRPVVMTVEMVGRKIIATWTVWTTPTDATKSGLALPVTPCDPIHDRSA